MKKPNKAYYYYTVHATSTMWFLFTHFLMTLWSVEKSQIARIVIWAWNCVFRGNECLWSPLNTSRRPYNIYKTVRCSLQQDHIIMRSEKFCAKKNSKYLIEMKAQNVFYFIFWISFLFSYYFSVQRKLNALSWNIWMK